MNLPLYHGRPEEESGRLPKEIRVYDLLDRLGISYDRADHESAMNMEICRAGSGNGAKYRFPGTTECVVLPA